MRNIGILGAMSQEIDEVKALLTEKTIVNIANREFVVGKIGTARCVVAFSKWGKVAATITATCAANAGAKATLKITVTRSSTFLNNPVNTPIATPATVPTVKPMDTLKRLALNCSQYLPVTIRDLNASI